MCVAWRLVTLLHRGVWRTSWNREACTWIRTVKLANITSSAQKFLFVPLIFFTFLVTRCLLTGVTCCLLSCVFLVDIRMQNTCVLKDQEFSPLSGQGIPCMLLNQSVFHLRCLSSSPLLPGLSQFNLVHVPRSCLICILIFLSPLLLGLPCVLTLGFPPPKRCVHFHTYHMPAHFIPLDFIDHLNSIWWKVQMKLFIVQLSTFFIPRHPILNLPQSVSFPYCT